MGDVTVKVVPWDYDFTNEDYDGLFISNGPGDPATVTATISHIQKAYQIGKPIFGKGFDPWQTRIYILKNHK